MTRSFQRTAFLLAMLLAVGPTQAMASKIGKIFDKNKNRQAYVPNGEWGAYFKDDKGERWAVVEPMEKNEDREWPHLEFTEYSGPKSRLAVMMVENGHPSIWREWVHVSAIEDLLATAMLKTHRFELVERKLAQGALNEQDFGTSGRFSPQSVATTGKMLGAEYLIYASINEFNPEKESSGAGLKDIPLIGKFSGGKKVAEITMSFKVFNATSGSVLFMETVRAEANDWSLGFEGLADIGGGGGQLKKSAPVSYALQSCINKASYIIASKLRQRTWIATVISAEEGNVYINAGSNRGVQSGLVLICFSKGQELIDPDTGLSLGADTKAIGQLQVTTVKDEFSIAAITEGCAGLKPGDKVEMAAAREN